MAENGLAVLFTPTPGTTRGAPAGSKTIIRAISWGRGGQTYKEVEWNNLKIWMEG